MIKKILIANRGEIAIRIAGTCREMGIKTVAVYSDADKNSLHRYKMDESLYLGSSEPAESYLNLDKIIDAAKKTSADAIHPGYGFLAENSEFALRCQEENIIFIGPDSEVIKNLGDKIKAREIMTENNVPVIPGFICDGDKLNILEECEKIGWPVMIKAAKGGGGKGMRIVDSPLEFFDAKSASEREAFSAFGDKTVYIEKFFKNSRHIEFQILADNEGNTVHLYERECSIQRRHQKIVEETPSTALTPELRVEMGDAAVRAAKASGYTNAGTVEFLLDENSEFYFLEVNTRLQVEHSVTEMTTGIDLVKEQIKIASGQPLSFSQNGVSRKGHSIECRIYAEDPANNFFPSPGKIDFIEEPSGPGIRNDCGVYSGYEVPVEYDPIISKLTVHATDRNGAINKMKMALENYFISGVSTPIAFLIELIQSKAFIDGKIYTDFIDKYFSDWSQNEEQLNLAVLTFIANEILGSPNPENTGRSNENYIPEPWQTLGSWKI